MPSCSRRPRAGHAVLSESSRGEQVTLGKSPPFPGPQFPHLYRGWLRSPLARLYIVRLSSNSDIPGSYDRAHSRWSETLAVRHALSKPGFVQTPGLESAVCACRQLRMRPRLLCPSCWWAHARAAAGRSPEQGLYPPWEFWKKWGWGTQGSVRAGEGAGVGESPAGSRLVGWGPQRKSRPCRACAPWVNEGHPAPASALGGGAEWKHSRPRAIHLASLLASSPPSSLLSPQ